MGKLRDNKAKALSGWLVGLSTDKLKQAKDIINLYKTNIIGNYRTAENLLNKVNARGKGQEKLADKLVKLKKVNIISSIMRFYVKTPKSTTSLHLNTDEREFKQIYNNPTSKTHQDIYPAVLKEATQMLRSKKSMKLTITVHYEIARYLHRDKDGKLIEVIGPDSRIEMFYDKTIADDVGSEVEVRPSPEPCSSKVVVVNNANLKTILLNEGDELDTKLAAMAHVPGSEWFLYKLLKVALVGFTTKPVRGSSYIPTPEP